MSSMRIMTREEFEAALVQNGFNKTDKITKSHTLWYHSEHQKHFTITDKEDEIPDFILDQILSAVDKLYPNKKSTECVDKKFAVTEKEQREKLKVIK